MPHLKDSEKGLQEFGSQKYVTYSNVDEVWSDDNGISLHTEDGNLICFAYSNEDGGAEARVNALTGPNAKLSIGTLDAGGNTVINGSVTNLGSSVNAGVHGEVLNAGSASLEEVSESMISNREKVIKSAKKAGASLCVGSVSLKGGFNKVKFDSGVFCEFSRVTVENLTGAGDIVINGNVNNVV